MIREYVKKPVRVQAVQFTGKPENISEVAHFMYGAVFPGIDELKRPILKIPTLEGVMTANAGDYIIKGVNGEFYPCKPDIFAKTYEETL